MNFHSATTPSTISITWVATSPVEAERQPIGKVWALKGKWPVTAGVKRTSYFLEPVVYENLDEATDDVAQRIRVGKWTMVTGAPRGGLDLTKVHARSSDNFVDAPTTLFIADFDGFTADPGEDLSKPEHFGDPIASALRTRLTAAGIYSLAEATFVLTATASTGFDPTSKGEPAYGCARFRLIFETTTPLTLAQQGVIAVGRGTLLGFGTLNADGKPSPEPCIDTNIYPPAYNIFTDRPILPAGVEDPIEHPVWTFDGDEGHERVDPVELMRELGLGESPGDGLLRFPATAKGPADRQPSPAGSGAGAAHPVGAPSGRRDPQRPLARGLGVDGACDRRRARRRPRGEDDLSRLQRAAGWIFGPRRKTNGCGKPAAKAAPESAG